MIEDGNDPFVGLEPKAEDNIAAEEMVGEGLKCSKGSRGRL